MTNADFSNCNAARRRALRYGAAAAAGWVLVEFRPNASFAGPASREDFHYQDHPKDGHRCSGCAAFVPPAQNGAPEPSCRIVAGPISPDGWCMAFSAKRSG